MQDKRYGDWSLRSSNRKNNRKYPYSLMNLWILWAVCNFCAFWIQWEIDRRILFIKALLTHTTCQCLYNMFLEATQDFYIDWVKKCITICSDRAKAMIGSKSGFITRLKALMPNACWMYCFLHRQALAVKTLPKEYNEVLNMIIKAVTSIKGKALDTFISKNLWRYGYTAPKFALPHIMWLSKGKEIRILELRAELLVY